MVSGILLLIAAVCCGEETTSEPKDTGFTFEFVGSDEGGPDAEEQEDKKVRKPEVEQVEGGLSESAWPIFGQNSGHTGQSAFVGAKEPVIHWSFGVTGKVSAAPVIGKDGTLYLSGGDTNLYAISPTGNEKWFFQTGGCN
jgi:outer membrane protein assembly factor BamB